MFLVAYMNTWRLPIERNCTESLMINKKGNKKHKFTIKNGLLQMMRLTLLRN